MTTTSTRSTRTGWPRRWSTCIRRRIPRSCCRASCCTTRGGRRCRRTILADVGHVPARTDAIAEIVDGHDSRLEALSLDDALVKDADKLWRLTPHGVDTVMDWFGLTREQAHRLIGSRVHDHLFTDAARTIARGLAAVAWVDSSPQRTALG